MLEILCAKRREIFTNDYPPVVTEKAAQPEHCQRKAADKKERYCPQADRGHYLCSLVRRGPALCQRHYGIPECRRDRISFVAGGGLV